MDIRDYYEYVADGSDDWHIKQPPSRNPHFERELELLAGTNYFGKPILRVSWAGTLKSDTARKDTLKYKKIWRGLTSFTYKDDEGREVKIKRMEDAPAGKVVIANHEERELGRLRWVIEIWQSIEDAIRGGRFDPEVLDSEGQPLYCNPPREGVYNAWIFVESATGQFRDLDNLVLEEVKRQWRWNEDNSLDQKIADLKEEELREAKLEREAAQAVWN